MKMLSKKKMLKAAGCTALTVGMMMLSACASTSESASKDTLTEQVGVYPPAPAGPRPKVGVPQFSVQGQFSGPSVDSLAADQMTTLLVQSGRFMVIERAQLQKLLDEQNLEGIVKPGELAKPGQVRGVDYLLLGKVTNLAVVRSSTDKGLNLAGVSGFVNTGGFGYNDKETKIQTQCGVDIRLVDPTTGAVVVANQSEYNKTDTASAMGVSILGSSAESGADVQLSEDDKGRILRLALDDALRKSLPQIDNMIRNMPPPAPAK